MMIADSLSKQLQRFRAIYMNEYDNFEHIIHEHKKDSLMRKFLAVIQFWLTITKVCSENTIFTVGANLRVGPYEILRYCVSQKRNQKY